MLIVAVWAGPPWFTALVAVVAAIGALEFAGMARHWGDRAYAPVGGALATGLVVAGHFLTDAPSSWAIVPPVFAAAAGLCLMWMLTRPRGVTGAPVWVTSVGVGLLLGGLLLHGPLMRGLDEGREWVLFLLLTTFATDTGAFITGRTLGRHPLAPSISPSKTLEGALGGLVCAMGAAVALLYILDLSQAVGFALGLGALIAIVGQIGDLAESRMKRAAGLKDSGRVLPGHGGVLDRLDSIVLTLVVVYYFVS